MDPLPTSRDLEPLVLARPLAVLLAAVVIAASGLAWGPGGTLAAVVGSVLSLINVFVLERLGARAAQQAVAGGPGQAASGLHAALVAKTVVLLTIVALLAGTVGAGRLSTPFGLGLLVSVFALILAGLLAALRGNP